MAIKKSEFDSSLGDSCDELRGSMHASQYAAAGMWLEFSLPKTSQAGAKHDPDGPSKASVKTAVKIRQLRKNNPEMTLAEVAGVISKSVRTIELARSKLVKAGRLKPVGPQKGGRWEVRK